MNTSEILTRAADLIEERGWAQHWYVNECGGLCARGAIYAAAGFSPATRDADDTYRWLGPAFYDSAAIAAETALGKVVPYGSVARWNDAASRTATEVINTLRGAAEAARAEQ